MKIQKNIVYPFLRYKLNLISVIQPQKCGNYALDLFCKPPVKFKGRYAKIFETAEPLSFFLQNTRINGYRVPSKENHKKVLILHGFGSSVHKFEKLAAAFSLSGYEVLAFDAPAHGISDGKTVNALDYCNMIQKIHQTYGPIDVFVAHSMGGLAVSPALEAIPHSENTVLALIAPAAETTTALDNALALLKISNKKIKKLMIQSIILKSGKTPEWFSIRRAIKNIKAKILWVQDTDDFITPMADVEKVMKDNPANTKFYITHGLGHQNIYRSDNVINEILAFCNSPDMEKD